MSGRSLQLFFFAGAVCDTRPPLFTSLTPFLFVYRVVIVRNNYNSHLSGFDGALTLLFGLVPVKVRDL